MDDSDIEPQSEPPGLRLLRFLGLEFETPEKRSGRSCVLVQIDGLSHEEFLKAVGAGKMPFIAKLLKAEKAVAGPWRSMLPTSTGAFQAGLFYGDNDDIPGFFWFDKSTREEVRMNSAADVAALEERVAERVTPFAGLLNGGAAYTSIFTGGATESLLTFARLFRPSLNVGTRPRWILYFLLTQILLLARLVYYSVVEVLLALFDMVYGLLSLRNKFLEFQFVFPRIACVVFCREIATLAAILDIRRGVGPIYLNFLGYDEHAHHRGPSSTFAQWTLKGVDASVKRIHDAIQWSEQDGVRSYDLYVWSDHGQVKSVPFQEQFGQEPERHFELLFDTLYAPTDDDRARARAQLDEERLGRGRLIRGQQRRHDRARIRRQADVAQQMGDALPRPLRRLYDRLLRSASDVYVFEGRDGVSPESPRLKFISTGPVALLYLDGIDGPVTFEEWQARFPEFLTELAHHEGVGFAMIRTRDGGARVGAAGEWFDLGDSAGMEEKDLHNLAELLREHGTALRRWTNLPSSGDILMFGHRAATGRVFSYSYERGAHAGPSRLEVTPFILVPQRVAHLWPELTDPGAELLSLATLHERLRAIYYRNSGPEQIDG
jgi:hypothetical protein